MNTSSRYLSLFVAAFLCGLVSAQSSVEPVALTNEEAVAFIKGKNYSTTRLAGGSPSIQFKDDGSMYGNSSGSSDSDFGVMLASSIMDR